MPKIYPYVIALLAGLWLSVTALFVGPENLTDFFGSFSNSGNLAVTAKFSEEKITGDSDFQQLTAVFWGVIREVFAEAAPTITVVKSGGGNGIVFQFSGVSGLDLECGFNCSQTSVPWYGPDGSGYYRFGAISALPGPDSDFTGWSGCDNNALTPQIPKQCKFDVTLTPTNRTVTANFTAPVANNTLTINKTGSTGRGLVYFFTPSASSYGVIANYNCDVDCLEMSQTFKSGMNLTLTATADTASNSVFDHWEGACTGATTCAVNMNGAKTVTAVFTSATPPSVSGTNKLIVKKSGPGLISIDASICRYACIEASKTFYNPTNLTLTGNKSTNSMFPAPSWSGCDSTGGTAGQPTCTIAVNGTKTVTLTSDAVWYSLDLDKTGSGQGTITSDFISGYSGQIDCGSTCVKDSAVFPRYGNPNLTSGTPPSVTLTATAAVGSTFSGWSGACSGTGTCAVAMDNHKKVEANFSAIPQTLTVNKTGSTGNGAISGTITSGTGADIVCDSGCSSESQDYNFNTQITLTAAPDVSSTFTGWSGACSGAGTCVVTMDAAKTVTAVFAAKTVTLNVWKGYDSTGAAVATITVSPAGTSCGGGCYTFNYGTAVTVTVSGGGSVFSSWTGDCTGTSNSCSLMMNGNKTVYANFGGNFTISVSNGQSIANPGSGVVEILSASSGGITQYSGNFGGFLDESKYGVTWPNVSIDCFTGESSNSDDCKNDYTEGDIITLIALPSVNSNFAGWANCENTGIYHYAALNKDFPTCTISKAAGIGAAFDGLDTSEMSSLMDGLLNVSKTGDLANSAQVTSAYTKLGTLDNGSINCGAKCSDSAFVSNQPIQLSAVPASGTYLDSWTGCQSVDYSTNNPVCTVYAGDYPTLDSYSGKYITNRFHWTVSSNAGFPFYDANDAVGNYWGGTSDRLVATPCKKNPLNIWQVDVDSAVVLRCDTDYGVWEFSAVTPGTYTDGTYLNGPSVFANCPSDPDHVCLALEAYSGYQLIKPLRTVTANFKYFNPILTVTKSGSGTGVVTTSDYKIFCGLRCSNTYTSGNSVTITATPAQGSGVCSAISCSTAPVTDSAFTITTSQTRHYIFNRTILNVAKVGNGVGRVALWSIKNAAALVGANSKFYNPEFGNDAPTPKWTGYTAGINCGADCYEDFEGIGPEIELIALPLAPSTFVSWTGCNATFGTGNIFCRVYVTDIKDVIARFDAIPAYGVTVQKAGLGSGTVSGPDNFICDANCQQTYKIYTGAEMTALVGPINLSAAPSANSIFDGWSGCDSVSGNTCVLTANSYNKLVTAIFNPILAPVLPSSPPTALFTLNISKSGQGSVLGLDGVDCGAAILTCSKTFNNPITVNLNASPSEGSEFSNWGGDASSCSSNLACSVEFTSCLVGVSSINPNVGIQGASAAISSIIGNNFASGATVKLTKAGQSDINCTGFAFTNDTTLSSGSCDITSAALGAWDVVVTAGGKTGKLIGGFSVAPFDYSLTIDSGSGSVAQGSSISPKPVLTATKIGGTAQSVSFVISGLPSGVTASAPSCTPSAGSCNSNLTINASNSAPAGSYNLTITGTSSGIPPKTVTYNLTVGLAAPTISAITPNSGVNNASVTVTVNGTKFGDDTAVKLARTGLSDIVCTGFSVSATALINGSCNLAGASLGAWNVVVTNPDGQSATLTDGFTVNESFDYTLTASPSSQTAVKSGPPASIISFVTNINITQTAGASQSVSISFNGDTSNFTTVANPNSYSCTPSGVGTTCSISLTQSMKTKTPGTYNITAIGASSGASNKTAAYSLTLVLFDYSLSLSSSSGSAAPGSSVSTNVTATLAGGTPAPVAFSATGLPAGATAAFTSTSCTPTCSSTLTINVGDSVSAGSYPITITGTASGIPDKTTTYNLTVIAVPKVVAIEKTGTGKGQVSISDGVTTTNCSAAGTAGACLAQYTSGTTVTLTASPDPDQVFAGFSGGTCTTSPCTFTLTNSVTVTATFNDKKALGVSKIPIGTTGGSVTASPATGPYLEGTTVNLTASPNTAGGYAFERWGGACSGTSPTTCSILMNATKNVIAIFATSPITNPILAINKAGTGKGTVNSASTPAGIPANISCGVTSASNCAASYTSGTSVILTAVLVPNTIFTSWSGCDSLDTSVTPSKCLVTMNSDKTVTATFDAKKFLQVSKLGGGSITATGIACGTAGTDCSEYYNPGASVTLTAAADASNVFAGWYGACAGTGACIVPMNANHSVSALFIAAP